MVLFSKLLFNYAICDLFLVSIVRIVFELDSSGEREHKTNEQLKK